MNIPGRDKKKRKPLLQSAFYGFLCVSMEVLKSYKSIIKEKVVGSTMKYRYLKRGILLFFIALLLYSDKSLAAGEKVIRVGWYEKEGYFEKDKDGNIYGFGVDYLNAIADYTGWKYEFKEGTKRQCMNWLVSGSIDLLSPVGVTEELNNAHIAREVIGEDYGYLYKSANNFEVGYEEIQRFENMTVGMEVESGLEDNLKRYCEDKGISFYEIKQYSTTDEMINELAVGKLDAVVADSYVNLDNMKVIGRFSNGRVTFAVSRQELVNDLNDALESIKLDNPSFTEDLRKLYFSEGSQNNLEYRKEEKRFLDQKHNYKVLLPAKQYPICYLSDDGRNYRGIAPEILKKISYYTDIDFQIEYVDYVDQGMEMIADDQADILGGIVLSTQDIHSFNTVLSNGETVSFTAPFYEVNLAIVGRKNTDMNGNLAVAVPSYLQGGVELLEEIYPHYSYVVYSGDEECFDKIIKREVDAAVQTDLKINELMIYDKYKEIQNLKYIPGNYSVTFLVQTEDELLISVLDKSLNSISPTSLSSIVNNNIQHIAMEKMTLTEIWEEYESYIILVMIATIATFASILGYSKYKREERSKEKAYRDSVAKISSMEKFRIDVTPLLRSPAKTDYYVIAADIDKFKVINDLYGYEQGDMTIAFVASVLKQNLGSTDFITRSIADNFVVLKRANNQEEIEAYLVKVFEVIDRAISEKDIHYHMIIKAGIYQIRPEDDEISSIIDKANLAKISMGRFHQSSYRFYSEEMRQKNLEVKRIENNMEEALKNNEFSVYLQPQVDLVTKKIVSAEALVRWIHPTEGMIPPGKFIPVFENNGFVVQLDLFVWEEAIKTLVRWRDNNQIMVPIAINLSRIDVGKEGMIDRLIGMMEKYRLEKKWIKTELTESACLDNDDLVMNRMHQLKEYGFRIAVDDFGSGYSSLHLLKRMPIDILKIDKSFLDFTEEIPLNDEIVMRDVVEMGKHLNLQIIVEGVETVEQSDFLEAIGCDIAQGYFYGKPMPVEEFEKLLLEHYGKEEK